MKPKDKTAAERRTEALTRAGLEQVDHAVVHNDDDEPSMISAPQEETELPCKTSELPGQGKAAQMAYWSHKHLFPNCRIDVT